MGRKNKKRKRKRRGRGDSQQSGTQAAVASDAAAGSASTDAPAESKPAESKPAESKPAESKPAESKPADSKPAETKPAKADKKADKPAKKSKQVAQRPEDALPWWQEWMYKPQRGQLVRWISVGIFGFLMVYGVYGMYFQITSWGGLTGTDALLAEEPSWWRWWNISLVEFTVPIYESLFQLTVGKIVSVLLGIGALLATVWLFFGKPEVSEFMIETENEMRKVSWPSKQELKGSTIAVVVATLLLGAYLFFVDMALSSVVYYFINVST